MSIELKQIIGMRVKAARHAKNISQSVLAEEIDRTKETVSNIERGLSAPTIETLERLSNALDVPLSEFFEGAERSTSNKRRMELEVNIRECLKELSVNELKIAEKQIQALANKDG